jgi:hypothetical protein
VRTRSGRGFHLGDGGVLADQVIPERHALRLPKEV